MLMAPNIASIMSLAGPDLIIILLIVLLLFGSKKLPELARGMGRAVKEFGAARDDIEKGLSPPAPAEQPGQNFRIEKTTKYLRSSPTV
jgi:sec-independent protein translocase protein TatA